MVETASPHIGPVPTRLYKFDDLRLQVDHRLQIEAPNSNPGEHIHVRLLGYLKGASLIIKPPTKAGGGILFDEGDEVVVRGFSGRIAFAFTSAVEKIRFSPYPYCHLRFPSEVRGAEIRKAVRARVNIPARVTNLKLGESVALEATISDISAAGALLTSPIKLGEVGDTVTTNFRFWVPPNDYEVNLQAAGIIQTITPLEGEHAPNVQYGIKFQGMRSTEAILLQTLVYQHLLETA